MSNALSPEETEALADACRTAQSAEKGSRGEQSERQIRPYDFVRPERFSGEHLKALNRIHSGYAARFSASLAGLLGIPVEAKARAIEQLKYQQHWASVAENRLFFEVSLDPLTRTAVFEFSPSVAGACIDSLTGGVGRDLFQISGLSDMDRVIMSTVVESLLKEYAECWSPCVTLTAAVSDAGFGAELKDVLLPAEPVLVACYEVDLGEANGSMSVCIPAGAVEAVLPSLTASKAIESAPKQTAAAAEALHESLAEMALTCKAVLGRTALTAADVIGLQEGDIIRLDAKPSSELEFWVGERQAYSGVCGRSGGKLGIRITRAHREGSTT